MVAILAVRRWWFAALIAVSFAAGLTVAGTHLLNSSSSTKVLGEKIQGSGSSSSSPSPNVKPTSPGNGNGNNGNGNGNGGGNGSKSFTIAGQVGGLYPGGTVHLQLTVTNPENQPMTVQSLSASLASIVKASGAPAGTCSPTVTIGSWTGSAFQLPRNTNDMAVPGYIPVTISHSAPDACQGASFNLTYSGLAVQS